MARHERLLFAVARHHVASDDDALDACQEALVKAWRAIGRFEGGAEGLRAWLVRIVGRAAIDRRRREARHRHLGLEREDPDGGPPRARPLAAAGRTPEELAADGQLSEALDRAIARLPTPYGLVVTLDRAGLDYGEIAAALGIPRGTVKSRLARGRLALRAMLTGEPEWEPFAVERRLRGPS